MTPVDWTQIQLTLNIAQKEEQIDVVIGQYVQRCNDLVNYQALLANDATGQVPWPLFLLQPLHKSHSDVQLAQMEKCLIELLRFNMPDVVIRHAVKQI